MNTLVEKAIAKGIEEVNLQQESDWRLANVDTQLLIGEGGYLDSLGILVFLTAIESYLMPSIPDSKLVELLMTAENDIYFKSIGTLKRYLCSLT